MFEFFLILRLRLRPMAKGRSLSGPNIRLRPKVKIAPRVQHYYSYSFINGPTGTNIFLWTLLDLVGPASCKRKKVRQNLQFPLLPQQHCTLAIKQCGFCNQEKRLFLLKIVSQELNHFCHFVAGFSRGVKMDLLWCRTSKLNSKYNESNAHTLLVRHLLRANQHQPWLRRCCDGADTVPKEHCAPSSRQRKGKTGWEISQKYISK